VRWLLWPFSLVRIGTIMHRSPIQARSCSLPGARGSTHSRPSPEERNVGDVAPKLPSVVLELEIAKRVAQGYLPALSRCCFLIALVRSARRRSYSSAKGQKTSVKASPTPVFSVAIFPGDQSEPALPGLAAEILAQLGCGALHRVGVGLGVVMAAAVDETVLRIWIGN